MIRIADLPQLRLLAWNRPEEAWLDEAEAALIQRLTIEQGKGLLLV
jgi:hypothetical protein